MDPKSSNNEKKLNLPFGYRFDPTSSELIDYYLIPKFKGEELPSNYVVDLDDLYICEPHQLPLNQLEHVKENEAYFFTVDSNINSTEVRKTPDGYWKVYRENVLINRADEVIGYTNKLLYHDFQGNETKWKMIEYRCHPSLIPTTSTNVKNYIICKIKPRKKKEQEISEEEK